jgi:hypothetical protein
MYALEELHVIRHLPGRNLACQQHLAAVIDGTQQRRTNFPETWYRFTGRSGLVSAKHLAGGCLSAVLSASTTSYEAFEGNLCRLPKGCALLWNSL